MHLTHITSQPGNDPATWVHILSQGLPDTHFLPWPCPAWEALQCIHSALAHSFNPYSEAYCVTGPVLSMGMGSLVSKKHTSLRNFIPAGETDAKQGKQC